MKGPLPLRIVVPLLFVVTVVVQLVVMTLYHELIIDRDALDDLHGSAQTELTHFTANLVQSYQSGDMNAVNLELTMLATIPSIKTVQVIDHTDSVISSYPRDLEKSHIIKTLPTELVSDIAKVRKTNSPLYIEQKNTNSYFAMAPFTTTLNSGSLSTAIPSLLVIEYDKEIYEAMLHKIGFQHSLFVSMTLLLIAILFFLYLQKFVTARALKIIKDTHSFGQSDYSIRTTIEGNDELGQIAKAINFMADDVQKNRQELLESEKRFRSIFESISLIAIELDRYGNVTFANPYLYELTGWSEEEVLGNSWFTRFIPTEEQTTIEEVFAFLQNEARTESVRTIENVILTKSGDRRLIRWTNLLLNATDAEKIAIVSLGEDVTNKAAEDEECSRRLRLESLSQLSGGIAHDFNNILAILFGFIDLAGNSIERNELEPAREYIENAMGAFQRARALSDQLLTFSKGGAPVKTSANLAEIIRNCVSFILSGSGIAVHYDMPQHVPLSLLDPNQIARVFENLAANAREAMGESGTIIISLQLLNNQFMVSFSDDGPGISDQVAAHIFDPFYTTKEFGHGLGLATVHSIVSQHEGTVSVQSLQNRGTRFTITLPYHPASEQHANVPVAAAVPICKGMQVLVLDDEAMILKMMRISLERAGFTVVTVADGFDAITEYQNMFDGGTRFSCAILDLTLPGGIDGKQVASEILKIDPSAHLFVSSGYSDDPVMANPREYGFAGALAKPFKFEELLDMIKPLQKNG